MWASYVLITHMSSECVLILGAVKSILWWLFIPHPLTINRYPLNEFVQWHCMNTTL